MKVAVVTGGTRGIGAAICCALQQKNYHVIATYASNQQDAQAFFQRTNIPVYQWDIQDWKACEQGIATIENEHGPIEILINNAGICDDAMISRMTIDQWHKVINTNLNSVFYMCRNIIDSMCQRGYGRIVNIGSINGARSAKGISNYSASKSGITGFTKALACEVAQYGVTANIVAPGYIRTGLADTIPVVMLERIMKQIPLKRMGIPEEVAALVTFLISSAASFITGATFHINGGQWMGH